MRASYSLALLVWNARLVSAFSFAPSTSKFVLARNTPTSELFGPFQREYSSTRKSFLAMSTSDETEVVKVGANLEEVRQKIVESCEASGRDVSTVQLVAVSKTKPLDLVKEAYANGQRVFGENYAQELVEKAGSIGESDVVWHFIGGLQSNKANMLVKGVVPHGTLVVETVSSLKVAKKLDSAMSEFDDKKLDIFVQVNTSGEESKNGVAPTEVAELCKEIASECERIQLKGVMTIGAPGDISCLESLATCRDDVATALGMETKDLGLSMGMSGDYEVAICKGSTNVRVGSTIFGARDYSNKA